MMHHLRLIKGLSYHGAVKATKENPDVFTDDEVKYTRAMQSGYFEEITASEEVSIPEEDNLESVFEEEVDSSQEDSLGEMTVSELKAYASLNGIELGNSKKRDDILEAIRNAEAKAREARADLLSE